VGTKVLASLTSSGVPVPPPPPDGAPPSSPTPDQALLDAFRSFKTAVDGFEAAVQDWAQGRRLPSPPVPSPDAGADAAAAGVPSPRVKAATRVPQPSR
jgi:hypothetical protein